MIRQRFLTQRLAGIIVPLTLRESNNTFACCQDVPAIRSSVLSSLILTCSCSSSHLSQIYNFEAALQQSVGLPQYLVILTYTMENHLHTCRIKSENF